jgi:hypothetical protein
VLAVDGVALSTVIMYHPSRAELIPSLLDACGPLAARVVEDPDPTGFPSPLRTAKRAWAASLPGATHHLVLQDDVRPSAHFAQQLTAAIRARPDDAIALYVHWHSPLNAYLTRLAAVSGSAWAALSYREWVPTLGLVLPAAEADGLAEWLAGYPDEVRDDDELVVEYCAARGLRVLATVPNLVDHDEGPSLTWNQAVAVHRATVTAGDRVPTPADWADQRLLENGLLTRAYDTGAVGFSVEIQDSQCGIRLLPGVDETIGTLFTWQWMDAVGAIGVPGYDILDSLAAHLATSTDAASLTSTSADRSLLREVWAAGYLLGWDSARLRGAQPVDPARLPVRVSVVESWLRSGIGDSVLATLPPVQTSALQTAVLTAIAEGERHPSRSPGARDSNDYGISPPLLDALAAMAERDARALAQPPKRATDDDQAGLEGVDLLIVPCPWCGSTEPDERELLRTLPFAGTRIVGADEGPRDDSSTLAILACELPSRRSLIAIARAKESGVPGATHFRTRAVAYLESGSPLAPADHELADSLIVLNQLEAETTQAEPLGSGRIPSRPLILPCATTAAIDTPLVGPGAAHETPHRRPTVSLVSHHLPWHRLGDTLSYYLDRRAAKLAHLIADRARRAVGGTRSWDTAGGP